MMMPMMMVMSNDDHDDVLHVVCGDAGQDERQCMLGSRNDDSSGFGNVLAEG